MFAQREKEKEKENEASTQESASIVVRQGSTKDREESSANVSTTEFPLFDSDNLSMRYPSFDFKQLNCLELGVLQNVRYLCQSYKMLYRATKVDKTDVQQHFKLNHLNDLKIIVSHLREQHEKIRWHEQESRSFQKIELWQKFQRIAKEKKIEIDISPLHMKWQGHAALAHFTSSDIIIAKNMLTSLETYVCESMREIADKKRQGKGIEADGFIKDFEQYLQDLDSAIRAQQKIIVAAILARLRSAARHNDLSYDDIILDLELYLCEMQLIDSEHKLRLSQRKPRQGLTTEIFDTFHHYIYTYGSFEAQEALQTLSWMKSHSAARLPLKNAKSSEKRYLIPLKLNDYFQDNSALEQGFFSDYFNLANLSLSLEKVAQILAQNNFSIEWFESSLNYLEQAQMLVSGEISRTQKELDQIGFVAAWFTLRQIKPVLLAWIEELKQQENWLVEQLLFVFKQSFKIETNIENKGRLLSRCIDYSQMITLRLSENPVIANRFEVFKNKALELKADLEHQAANESLFLPEQHQNLMSQPSQATTELLSDNNNIQEEHWFQRDDILFKRLKEIVKYSRKSNDLDKLKAFIAEVKQLDPVFPTSQTVCEKLQEFFNHACKKPWHQSYHILLETVDGQEESRKNYHHLWFRSMLTDPNFASKNEQYGPEDNDILSLLVFFGIGKEQEIINSISKFLQNIFEELLLSNLDINKKGLQLVLNYLHDDFVQTYECQELRFLLERITSLLASLKDEANRANNMFFYITQGDDKSAYSLLQQMNQTLNDYSGEEKELDEKIKQILDIFCHTLLKEVIVGKIFHGALIDLQMLDRFIHYMNSQEVISSKLTPTLQELLDEKLLLAANQGNYLLVAILLRWGASLQAFNEQGYLCFHEAAVNGHLPTLAYLLSIDRDVNVQSKDGSTPLHSAAVSGHKDIVSFLLDNKAEVNKENYKGFAPLSLAAGCGHIEVMELLLKFNGSVNSISEKSQIPLHRAIQLNQLEAVRFLMAQGASVSSKDSEENTPLHIAAIYAREAIIKLLLLEGADPNVKNSREETPAEIAIRYNKPQISKYIQEQIYALQRSQITSIRVMQEQIMALQQQIAELARNVNALQEQAVPKENIIRLSDRSKKEPDKKAEQKSWLTFGK